MSEWNGEIHPFAERAFPLLPDDELDALAGDITANGLREPIVLDTDRALIDGRNRLAACERADVDPTFEIYDGDPIAYIVSANIARRHLSTGQRAMARAMALDAQGKRTSGRWAYGSQTENHESVKSGTWRNVMTQAGVVLDHAPDLVDEVVAGDIALDAAYKTANGRRLVVPADEVVLDDVAVDLPMNATTGQRAYAQMLAVHRGEASGPGDPPDGVTAHAWREATRRASLAIEHAPGCVQGVIDGEITPAMAWSATQVARSTSQNGKPQPARPTLPRNVPAEERCRQIRKLADEGMSSRQIGPAIGVSDEQVRRLAHRHGIAISADAVIGKTKRTDSTRIVTNTVDSLEGLVIALRLIDYEAINAADLDAWLDSLSASMKEINQFHTQMKGLKKEKAA